MGIEKLPPLTYSYQLTLPREDAFGLPSNRTSPTFPLSPAPTSRSASSLSTVRPASAATADDRPASVHAAIPPNIEDHATLPRAVDWVKEFEEDIQRRTRAIVDEEMRKASYYSPEELADLKRNYEKHLQIKAAEQYKAPAASRPARGDQLVGMPNAYEWVFFKG